MTVDWLWWGELNTIAFNTEYANSVNINLPHASFVSAQLSITGITIQDTTGYVWPNFISFVDANNILQLVAGQPVTLGLDAPKSVQFMTDCQNAAAVVLVTALGWG